MHSTAKKNPQITHSMPFLCKAHVQYALNLAYKSYNYMDTSPQHVDLVAVGNNRYSKMCIVNMLVSCCQ